MDCGSNPESGAEARWLVHFFDPVTGHFGSVRRPGSETEAIAYASWLVSEGCVPMAIRRPDGSDYPLTPIAGLDPRRAAPLRHWRYRVRCLSRGGWQQRPARQFPVAAAGCRAGR